MTTVDGIWRRVADAVGPLPVITANRHVPPGVVFEDQPRATTSFRFQLLGAIPAIIAGSCSARHLIPLQRGLLHGPDVEVERRSVVRKSAIYLVVFVSALAVLIAASFIFASIGRRLLGDPLVEQFNSLWHELGFPVITAVVFGTLWLFHRRVVESEAVRETEVVRAATIRRLYTYLIAAIGLAMAAIAQPGRWRHWKPAHRHETALEWLDLRRTSRSCSWVYPRGGSTGGRAALRLDDDERRSVQRRGYLYLVVLGGVLGALVFGSAALYRLLNATLAMSFTTAAWHDIWHFTVDAAVSAGAFLTHLRFVRADRVAAPEAPAAPETYAFLVRLGATIASRAGEPYHRLAEGRASRGACARRWSRPGGGGAITHRRVPRPAFWDHDA